MYKDVYGPSEIAKICMRPVSEIQSWLEKSRLASFTLPGGHIRVAHESLREFLVQNHVAEPETWKLEKQKPKVLLVEDDPDLLEIITELLKEENWLDVRSENNGFTAGLQIAGWHPDLILLDFLMPGITGFEVCRRLRSQETTCDIPVLALTSLSSEEDRLAIFESGASDYLGKPFHSAVLIKKVKALLGLESALRQVPEAGGHIGLRPGTT